MPEQAEAEQKGGRIIEVIVTRETRKSPVWSYRREPDEGGPA